MIQYVTEALRKLAGARNVGVVVLTQCASKMQFERGAAVVPAVGATAWDQGVATRIVLFHDWLWSGPNPTTARFASVQKANGKLVKDAIESVVVFQVKSVSHLIVHTMTPGSNCFMRRPRLTPHMRHAS